MDRPQRIAALKQLLRERIVLLDGAMGTMIQQHRLDEAGYRGTRFANLSQDVKGNNDLLTLTQPEIIADIHRAYLEAGSDIIETNTFNSTMIAQADYGMQALAPELNRTAAHLARRIADEVAASSGKTRFVAGALGPTNRTASISPDVNDPGFRNVSFDELVAAYCEATLALIDGGVDLILIETVFDTLNAKAALVAVRNSFEEAGVELPIIVSGTITDASGRTLSGQTTEAFWNSIRHAHPFAIGLNCALGAKDLRPYIEELSRIADTFVSIHPNAGLPNAFGEYDETPDYTSGMLREFAESGFLNIAGGCCGTTPQHIGAIVKATSGLRPRAIPVVEKKLRLSGLEPQNVGDDALFVNVGERTNVTGSRAFARMILNGQFQDALAVGRQQVDNGAQIIDVNMDEAMLDSQAAMTKFMNLVASEPDISRVPVMIDSSKWPRPTPAVRNN